MTTTMELEIPLDGAAALGESQVRAFLERLGRAVSAGDLPQISRCWDVPALVLSDEGATAVGSFESIEAFFDRAVNGYRARDLVSTRPVLERLEILSERLAAVDVRWLAFDERGREGSSERSHYVLRLGDDGEPRIRVALTRATVPR
jgi:hypothetical protein